ncbi:MAG: cyclic pyranopterin monophosphate synthase MoaC [Deltaproteobacteria bacterium]|nr:cyclic pyranopterin monophosphate synthase MoaC [Deltaproteobacteria bacterium]
MVSPLTHLDEKGRAKMVDVGYKDKTPRVAVARGSVGMRPDTLKQIVERNTAKGDVLAVARVAGIMAAKKTSDLIPLCHLLPISFVSVDFFPDEESSLIEIEATVKNRERTGVEMEALTAVAVAALTIYDMCKAVDRAMVIDNIRLERKEGGRSGLYVRSKK